MIEKCLLEITTKRSKFEFYGTIEQLIQELDDDEIPCKVKSKYTGRKMKIRKNMFGHIKEYPDY